MSSETLHTPELANAMLPAHDILYEVCDEARLTARTLATIDRIPEPTDFLRRANYIEMRGIAHEYSDMLSDPNADKIQATAARQADHYYKARIRDNRAAGGSPFEFVCSLAFAAAQEAEIIEAFRNYKYGNRSPSEASRAYRWQFITNLAFHAANHVYGADDRAGLLHNTHVLGQGINAGTRPEYNFAAGKMAQFSNELVNAFSVMNIFLEQDNPEAHLTQSMRTAGDELWREGSVLRKFSLKPAVAPTNLPGITNLSLRPGFEINEAFIGFGKKDRGKKKFSVAPENRTKYTLSGAVAAVVMSDVPMLRSQPVIDRAPYAGGRNLVEIKTESLLDADPQELKSLGDDHLLANAQLRSGGELHTLSGVPIRRWAEHLGAEAAYEQLRLEVLALHYDLIVPIYVQKMVKDQMTRRPETVGNAERVQEMAIARRRYLYEHKDEIVDKLWQEEAEYLQDAKGKKRHAVSGHPRELPEDCSATPEARERALVEGQLVLPEFGLTWVRYHERGSNGSLEAVKVRPVSGKYKDRQRDRSRR